MTVFYFIIFCLHYFYNYCWCYCLKYGVTGFFFFLGLDLYLTVLRRLRKHTGLFCFVFSFHLIQHIVLNSRWNMNLSHIPTVSPFRPLLAGKGAVRLALRLNCSTVCWRIHSHALSWAIVVPRSGEEHGVFVGCISFFVRVCRGGGDGVGFGV